MLQGIPVVKTAEAKPETKPGAGGTENKTEDPPVSKVPVRLLVPTFAMSDYFI